MEDTTMEFKGKTILITGGRRVGRVVADEIGGAGANVVMTFRSSHDEMAELSVTDVGPHGACPRVIRTFPLRV